MMTSRKRVNESKVYSEENEWNPFPKEYMAVLKKDMLRVNMGELLLFLLMSVLLFFFLRLYKLIPLMFQVGVLDFFRELDLMTSVSVLLLLGFFLLCVWCIGQCFICILDVCFGEYECMEAVISKKKERVRYGRGGIIGTFYSYEVRSKKGNKYPLPSVTVLAPFNMYTIYVLRPKGCEDLGDHLYIVPRDMEKYLEFKREEARK